MSQPDPYAILYEADRKDIDQFVVYHKDHPEVWNLFKQYAEQMYTAGRKKYSAWAIISRIRWDHDIEKTEEFKISNGYIALYARMLEAVVPKFKFFFQLRPLGGRARRPAPPRDQSREDWVR